MAFKKTFQVQALTLKYYNLGEADKILVLFSKEQGIIKAVAKGIKRTKSKFGGRLDLLNVNDLEVREGRNMGTIVQCETNKIFPALRLDYDKLIYSLYLGELVINFSNEGEPLEDIYNLLLFTLEILEKTEKPLICILWFEMQFLRLLGYQSNLTTCDICDSEVHYINKKLGFSLVSGSLICASCLPNARNYRLINDDIRFILKKLKLSEIIDVETFEPSEIVLQKSQDLLKEYLSLLSERKIKTLNALA